MLNIRILYNKISIIAPIVPTISVRAVFNLVKEKLGIEGDASDFLIWHNRPSPINDMPIGEFQINRQNPTFAIIEKDSFTKLDHYLNTIMPSLVCEAASFTPEARQIVKMISSMHSMIFNFTQEETQSSVLSILPFDRIEELEGDAQVAEITKWFKEDFFTFAKEFKCHVCNGETVPYNQNGPVTISEANHLASRTELYKCKTCGAVTRFPRYNDVAKLIETRIGRCGEFANTFGAILKALGFDVRLVNDLNDHIWVEFWSEEKQRYVHVDPCENIIDAPLTYEKGWGKEMSWVIAVGENQCQDVTKKYTQNFEAVSNRRRNFVTDDWYNKYIHFKNDELTSSLDAEEKDVVTVRQAIDIESMANIRAETLPEEERPRISGNE